MLLENKILRIQESLVARGVDGWLLYDFRKSNPLACGLLEIPESSLLTRRFFYWIPNTGVPTKLVSAVEAHLLDHLPGSKIVYQTWMELEDSLAALLKEKSEILMEYSPKNRVPAVSTVDGGTLELVRSCGVKVLSSADLLQEFTSVWDSEQLAFHFEAEQVVVTGVEKAWDFIAAGLQTGKPITEYDVQQYIIQYFKEQDCIHEGDPICAVNAHSADPHYAPRKESSSPICKGDLILIDLWCKKNRPRATYADITRVGIASPRPGRKHREIFEIVKRARDAATAFVIERFGAHQPPMGWEVDEVCRSVIREAGYGQYFIHRTGHNIGESDHGNGANIDHFETEETRSLLPGTCFSIEPGVYLPGEFGIRLEYNLLIHLDGRVQITGGVQNSLIEVL